jgi:hypothetical protein
MQTLDDKPETIHLYVVREKDPKPSILPIVLSALSLAVLLIFCVLTPYQQPEIRTVIRVPAVLLPIQTFSTTVAVIPTGIKTYPATTANGILTITNGSIISETLPKGMVVGAATLDYSVFVPAGSANGYGYTTVSAHALMSGKQGNIPAYGIDNVENASIYIRNLAAFHGGVDAYSVKVVTLQDRQIALDHARQTVDKQIGGYKNGLHYPCKEAYLYQQGHVTINTRCQFVSYSVLSYMHITGVQLQGKEVVVAVWFIPPLKRTWVK